MTEELEKNYSTFYRYIEKIIGKEATEALVDYFTTEEESGKDVLMKATFATTKDTGLAEEGSLIRTALDICAKATQINEILPEDKRTDNKSIYKVGLLSHIAKAKMLVPNTEKWQIDRGTLYTFAPLDGALRAGERSILIAANAGVKFTELEYEAMRIVDKQKEDDAQSKYFSSSLSTVIRQANELIALVNRVK